MQRTARPDSEYARKMVAALARAMGACAYLLPLLPVIYLSVWQDPALRLEDHGVHEVAILVATLEGLIISYVCWRCYLQSGERLVRHLTQGFLGFTVVYSLHGVFTPVADHHTMLFLLYGPASRLLMSVLLLMAVRASQSGFDIAEERLRPGPWWRFLGFLMLLNVLVGLLASSTLGTQPWMRIGPECVAAACNLTAFFLIRREQGGVSLLHYFSHALVWFAVSSIGFVAAQPWNHLWWVAHGTFALGFSILGFGVCKAYLNGYALGRVFGVETLFKDVEQHNAQLREACQTLSDKNGDLLARIAVLEQSQQAFKTLFSTVPDGILIVDMSGLVVNANGVAERVLGYAPGALVGMQVEMLMPSGYRELHAGKRERYGYMPQTRRMGSGGAPMPCLRRDGTLCYCDISIGGLVFQGAQCLVTFLREVAQQPILPNVQHATGQAASDRAALVATVMALVPDMLLEIRRNADGTYACMARSEACARVLGIDSALAPESWMQLLLSRVAPPDFPDVIGGLEAGAFEGSQLALRWSQQVPGKSPLKLQLESSPSQGDEQGNLRWLCLLRAMPPETV